MLITRKLEFDAGHRIPDHRSQCRNLHGHRYVLEVTLRGDLVDTEGAPDRGMVMDFADLKAIVGAVLDPFDHHVINDIPPFDQRNTTAELLAEFAYQEVSARLPGERLSVLRVEVWENESACAVYQPPAPAPPR